MVLAHRFSKAERISEKVKKQIEGQYLFVGVFTKRDKISAKEEWTTSSWVVDEKAYAFGKGKTYFAKRKVLAVLAASKAIMNSSSFQGVHLRKFSSA